MRRRATEDDEDDILEPAVADEDAVSDAGEAEVEEDDAGKPDEEGVQRHAEDDAGEEGEEEEEEEEEEGHEPDASSAVNKVEEREAAVPTKGAFFMHDDRMGGGRKPPPRRAGSGKKEEMLWCHDKFEELMREPEVTPRSRAESGRPYGGGKGGRADRGGRGAGKGRGGTAEAPQAQPHEAVSAPHGFKHAADARVASKSGAHDPSAAPAKSKGGRGSRAAPSGRGHAKSAPSRRLVAEPWPVAGGGAGALPEPAGGAPLPDAAGAAGGYADTSVRRAAGRGGTGDVPPPANGLRTHGYGTPRQEGNAMAHTVAGLNRSAVSFQPQYHLASGMVVPQPMPACAAGPALTPVAAAVSADAMQAQWAAEQHGMLNPYAPHGYTAEYTDLGQHYYSEGGMPVSAGMRGGMGMAMASTMAGGMEGMGGAYMGSPGYGGEQQSGYGVKHGSGGELSPAAAYHTSGLFTPEHMSRLRYEQGDVAGRGRRRPNLELNIDGYSLSTTRMGLSVLVPTGTRKVTIEKPAEA
eukprot:scaffold3777_cov123-Isochrysis_galbana.AAC.10